MGVVPWPQDGQVDAALVSGGLGAGVARGETCSCGK